jgi:hypothetical protein
MFIMHLKSQSLHKGHGLKESHKISSHYYSSNNKNFSRFIYSCMTFTFTKWSAEEKLNKYVNFTWDFRFWWWWNSSCDLVCCDTMQWCGRKAMFWGTMLPLFAGQRWRQTWWVKSWQFVNCLFLVHFKKSISIFWILKIVFIHVWI